MGTEYTCMRTYNIVHHIIDHRSKILHNLNMFGVEVIRLFQSLLKSQVIEADTTDVFIVLFADNFWINGYLK